MLPGLRFIFLTAMLSISLVVFGLGMLGMLRSTKERFATTTLFSRDIAPVMVQQPMIALLRTEPFESDAAGTDASNDSATPAASVAASHAPASAQIVTAPTVTTAPVVAAPTVATPTVATPTVPRSPTVTAAEKPAPETSPPAVTVQADVARPPVTERAAEVTAPAASVTAQEAAPAVAVPAERVLSAERAERALAAAAPAPPQVSGTPMGPPALAAEPAPSVAEVTAQPATTQIAKPALPATTELTETDIAIEPIVKLERPSSAVADAQLFGPDDQPAPPIKIADVKLPRERPIIGKPASELATIAPADVATQVAAHAVEAPQTTGSIPSIEPVAPANIDTDLGPSIPLDAAEVKLPRERPSPEKTATKPSKPVKKKRGRQASDDRTMVEAPQPPAEYRASTINLF